MKNTNQNTTQKIVISALLSAFVCVATMIIKIPSPMKGYINLGDSIVLVCGWVLSPLYAFISAGIGSGLADLLSGYAIYIPATFIIKGSMALIAYFLFKAINKKLNSFYSRLISAFVCEIVMCLGYYIFESILYGFGPSLVNIPSNAIQGVAGIIVGLIVIKVFDKSKIKI